MQTSSCDAKHVVVLAQNDSPCMGPIETCYPGQIVLFCIEKPQRRAGTHRDY